MDDETLDIPAIAADEPELSGSPAPIAERLRAARAGDLEAAYDLTARPLPLREAREVLTMLSRDPSSVDVELLAHRLGRSRPELLFSLLALFDTVGSARALYAAHAVSRLRDEDAVVERAVAVVSDLRTRNRPAVGPNSSEPIAALLALLTLPLSEQQAQMRAWREVAPERALAIANAAQSEDARLFELAKHLRYRSGTYYHHLREDIADFLLVAGIRGDGFRQAYRRLQQQLDPAKVERVFGLLPADLASQYLNWTIVPTNAKSQPNRAALALRLARKQGIAPGDLGNLERLADSDALTLACEAVLTLATLTSPPQTLGDTASRMLQTLPEGAAVAFAAEVAASRPEALALENLPPPRARRILASLDTSAARIADALARSALRSDDGSLVRAILEALPSTDDASRERIEGVVRARLESSAEGAQPEVVAEVLRVPALREIAWMVHDGFDVDAQVRVLPLLLSADDRPSGREQRVADLLVGRDDVSRSRLIGFAVAEVAAGRLEPSELASRVSGAAADDLAEAALERADTDDADAASAGARLAAGAGGLVEQASTRLLPSLRQAAARASGNAGVVEAYRRLELALTEPRVESERASGGNGEDAATVARLARSLATVGAVLRGTPECPIVELNEGFEPGRILQGLAQIDRAAHASGDEASRRVVSAIIDALGVCGLAARVVEEASTGGPLGAVLLHLSPAARQDLLSAASRGESSIDEERAGGGPAGSLTRDDLGRASSVSDTDGDDLESRLIRVARSGRAIADVRGALAGAERAARIAVAEASVATLAEVGALVDAYEQLLRAFADLGIAPAAPIGGELAPTELDSRLHKIAGEASSRYVVREAGLVVDGEVLVPAIVEGAPE